MVPELLRLLGKPQRFLASFRNGEIYIEEIATKRCVRVRALQGSRQRPRLARKCAEYLLWSWRHFRQFASSPMLRCAGPGRQSASLNTG